MIEKFEISKDIGFEDFSLHNDIEILKIADDPYDKGIWQRKPLSPNWDKVIDLSVNGLKKSRDLTLACRLTEALVQKYGVYGLKIGLNVIIDIFSQEYYPLNQNYRDRHFQWIDQKLPMLAFFDSLNKYKNSTHQALKDLKILLLEIDDLIEKMPISTDNFKNMIKNILNKISRFEEPEQKIIEHEEEDEQKLVYLINEFNNLMPHDKEKLKKILFCQN